MDAYAQTNVQLFDQLRSEGYSQKEREYVRDVYAFAMRLFAGFYLPSGKPFIDHLVGTASVLASLRVPVEVVAAGLIHAAYLHGDFGTIRAGISAFKREQVKSIVGEQVEDYIARYDRLLMTPEDIARVNATLDKLGAVDRYVVLMRLANELEHNLDMGSLYFAQGETAQSAYRRYMESRHPQLAALARRLGFESLAKEMERVFNDVATAELPLEPCIRCEHTMAYLVAPGSYRERLLVLYRRKFSEGRQWLLRMLHRPKSLGAKIFGYMRQIVQAPARRM